MAKQELNYYLNDLLNSIPANTTNEDSIERRYLIEEAINYLNNITTTSDPKLGIKSTKAKLYNNRFFPRLGVSKEQLKNDITVNLTENDVNNLIAITNRKVLAVRTRNTNETVHNYETYLKNRYNKIGYIAPTEDINNGINSITIRKRYPHEEEIPTGIDHIIYIPNNGMDTAKEYYKDYYTSQISGMAFTQVNKNKADFLALLDDIINNNAYPINRIQNPAIITNIKTALQNDNTNQTHQNGNTTLTIPGKNILGHNADSYTIVMREATLTAIENDLQTVFGDTNNNIFTVARVPLNTLTVSLIKRRNKNVIDNINKVLKEYSKRNTTGPENLSIPPLTRMLEILDFDENNYNNPNQFVELIGGYVPAGPICDEFMACAERLAKPDINFDFINKLPNFLPVRMPGTPPADSSDLSAVIDYEENMKKEYHRVIPELFHSGEYNYKKDRKKYPHEKFKWDIDKATIRDNNFTEHTDYYQRVYKDYMFYRKNQRPVNKEKIKKAPVGLVKKILNKTEFGKTLIDIRRAIVLNDSKKGPDGTYESVFNKRIIGMVEKAEFNAMIAAGVLAFKMITGTFTFGLLIPAFKGITIATMVEELVAQIRRIYLTYREMMEARVAITYSEDGLREAIKYKEFIENADPSTPVEEINKNKEMLKAYIAYYVANFKKFERSYKRLRKMSKNDYLDEKAKLEADEARYRTSVFSPYWQEGARAAEEYEDMPKSEFNEKIDAIGKGRKRY